MSECEKIYYDPDYKFPDYFDPEEVYEYTDEDFQDEEKMRELNQAEAQQSIRDDLELLEKELPLFCGCKGRFYNWDGDNYRECETIRTNDGKEQDICVKCAESLGFDEKKKEWQKIDKKLYEWQKDDFEEFWMISYEGYCEVFYEDKNPKLKKILKDNDLMIYGINRNETRPYITATKIHCSYTKVLIAYDIEKDEFRLK